MIKNLFFLSLIYVLFSVTAFSQIKQISANEFYAINSNGDKILNERSYRMETKTETMQSGKVIASVLRIEERLLPDKHHYVEIVNQGEKEIKDEWIRIGYMLYSRQNNELWTVKDLRNNGNGIGSGSGHGGRVSCAQYTEGSDLAAGASVRKIRQYLIEESSDGLIYDDFTSWIDQDGAFIKSERTEGRLEPKIEGTHSVVTFEYDPKITIEAPVK